MTAPGSGEQITAELVARCENYREDVDQPCNGRLRFRWGQQQAACDTCGGWCGIAVADWLTVSRADALTATPNHGKAAT